MCQVDGYIIILPQLAVNRLHEIITANRKIIIITMTFPPQSLDCNKLRIRHCGLYIQIGIHFLIEYSGIAIADRMQYSLLNKNR